MDDDPIINDPFRSHFGGGLPSPTPTPSPSPTPVDYTYLLDPSLLAAMKSRFVQSVDINPPYDQSIPKEYMDAERGPLPLKGDWEPFSDKERENEMPKEFKFEQHGDTTNIHFHKPIMRYHGSRIPIEGRLSSPEMI
jgi:hypothetical protein